MDMVCIRYAKVVSSTLTRCKICLFVEYFSVSILFAAPSPVSSRPRHSLDLLGPKITPRTLFRSIITEQNLKYSCDNLSYGDRRRVLFEQKI